MNKKKLLIYSSILFLIIILVKNFPSSYSKSIEQVIKNHIPMSVQLPLTKIYKDDISILSKRLSNDYNEKFLPKTQFANINLKILKLNFLEFKEGGYLDEKKGLRKTFFIEKHNDKLFIATNSGNFFYKELVNLKNEKNFYEKKISSNLILDSKIEQFQNILDFHIFENKLFISTIIKKNECYYLLVDVAEVNYDKLQFKNIFTSENNSECMKYFIQGGKIAMLNSTQLLLTTAGDILYNGLDKNGNEVIVENESDLKPQDDNSIFGKILNINIENSNYEIFNKGHRNSLGLVVDGDFILSTENGPRGGDELNLEVKGKDYGWSKASYGKKYSNDDAFLDHEKANYQEPIFAFVPSIGISEIIKIENNFDSDWEDNYLVGSLFYRHLIRVKLNMDRSKVLFTEKIFIGERIRDLLYDSENKTILLALEDTGSLGVFYKD